MKAAHPIVLLHGWASHPQVFRGLARVLEKTARVHLLPLPGYAAAATCAPYTLACMADAIAALAPKQCSVIGWSLGAQVALTWAQRAPQQVRRLALIAATPCFTQRNDWPHGTAASVMRQFTAQIQRDCPSVLRRFLALQSLGDAHAVSVAHKLRSALFTNPLPTQAVLEAGLDILRSADLRDVLASIAQPALILHGAHDAVTPYAAGEALSRALPNARLHTVANAGHAPFLTDLNAVATLLQAFLNEPAATV